jgi:hypothetical protein
MEPLVMEGREKGESIAATRALLGTDVNFGSLTRSMRLRKAAVARPMRRSAR